MDFTPSGKKLKTVILFTLSFEGSADFARRISLNPFVLREERFFASLRMTAGGTFPQRVQDAPPNTFDAARLPGLRSQNTALDACLTLLYPSAKLQFRAV